MNSAIDSADLFTFCRFKLLREIASSQEEIGRLDAAGAAILRAAAAGTAGAAAAPETMEPRAVVRCGSGGPFARFEARGLAGLIQRVVE